MSWIAEENKSSHTEMNGQSGINDKVDQLLKDLNEVSSNVDRGQQSGEDDLNAMKVVCSQTATTKYEKR